MPRVAIKCPTCGVRICDKMSPANGILEFKCPRCKNVFKINLALRKSKYFKFRIA